ncbi:MAG: DUF4199 domain-containing protein [Methylococcales bacterium]
MKNTIFKYGLIAGIIIIAIPTISGWITGHGPETYETGEIIGYSTIILSLMMIFFAVAEYQKKHQDEFVGFRKVFLMGAGISFISGFMFGLYNVIYAIYINPEFVQQYYDYYISNIQNSGATEESIAQQIQQLESEKQYFMNPAFNFIVMFATVFIIGLVVSIFSGLFQRDKNKQMSQTA